jgi:acyl-coenzyme A synthetase/AMP-(fatty) acid ligase
VNAQKIIIGTLFVFTIGAISSAIFFGKNASDYRKRADRLEKKLAIAIDSYSVSEKLLEDSRNNVAKLQGRLKRSKNAVKSLRKSNERLIRTVDRVRKDTERLTQEIKRNEKDTDKIKKRTKSSLEIIRKIEKRKDVH